MALSALALFLVGACRTVAPPGAADLALADGAGAAEGAPTTDDVLRALLASTAVPLASDPSCDGVGTRLTDRTVGDFLAGFLAAFSDSAGANWVNVASAPVVEGGERRWRSTVTLHRRADEEVWGWGVRFDLRAADRRIVAGSFRCLG